jgi:hypothetical protein
MEDPKAESSFDVETFRYALETCSKMARQRYLECLEKIPSGSKSFRRDPGHSESKESRFQCYWNLRQMEDRCVVYALRYSKEISQKSNLEKEK